MILKWLPNIIQPSKKGITHQDIVILYGSKSGNSAFIAKEAAKYFNNNQIKTVVKKMNHFKIQDLLSTTFLLAVISTHGEGEPPPSAVSFFSKIKDFSERLTHLNYSICALGDSSYVNFCQAGKDLDRKLKSLGANPIIPRTECDVDFREPATHWIKDSFAGLRQKKSPSPKINPRNTNYDFIETEVLKSLDKTGEFRESHKAVIETRYRLNPKSETETFHLILKTENNNVQYQPGDCIAIKPQNPAPLVDEILKHIKRPWDFSLTFNNQEARLGDILQSELEITRLSKKVLIRYAEITGNEDLMAKLRDHQEICRYTEGTDLQGLLNDFPGLIKPEDLLAIIERIKVRYYSVASSPSVTSDRIHLTVKQLSYKRQEKWHQGACSSHLNFYLKPGSIIDFEIIKNEGFHLPTSQDTPIIMIAAGTGIAPFVGFLQERSLKPESRNWLIFGEKSRAKDFLYKDFLLNKRKSGNLDRLDLAFSRDGDKKVYVQNKIRDNSETLLEWINSGAVIYVCGSLKMGNDVKVVLNELPGMWESHFHNSESLIDQLRCNGQFFEDLY